ncbi:MAG: flagellar assembly protein FliH [Pseudomonadota bacterium]
MSEDAAAERWQVPNIDGSDGKSYMTAGRLEALQREAWDEAFQKGYAEGLESGHEEAARRTARLDELLRALARPFDDLDDAVEKQLVELSMTVVRQLFRREIRLDPTHVIGIVRQAIQCLPMASRNVQVHLNPEDAALIRETLSPAEGEPAWSVVEDPLTERGGCRVTTENSNIDASTQARLNELINSIAGDERER